MKKLKNKNLPTVSFLLLSKNDEVGVKRILNSVKEQSYPKYLIDIVVVDDGSSDKSVNVARQYTDRVYTRPGGGLYGNWIYGMHKIKGDFFYYVEQDIELRGKKWVERMIEPLLNDNRLMASFTREGFPRKDQHWINRFLSYHVSQCDPLYEFLTPPLENTFFEQNNNYIVCKFKVDNLPPFGRMMYRTKYLKKTRNWKAKNYFDHDFMIQSIKAGFELFAYLPNLGIFHHHAKNFVHLVKKRLRNVDMHYFPYNEETEYKWLDVGNKKQVLSLVLWIVYANLFFPELVRGIFRFFKYRDTALLMQPIVSLVITDALLIKFFSNNVGRKMAQKAFVSVFNHSK